MPLAFCLSGLGLRPELVSRNGATWSRRVKFRPRADFMLKTQKTYLYLIGDGDDVRDRVEFYLLNSDLNALTHFSRNLVKAIDVVKEFAVSKMDAEVVYAAGDDVFFCVDKDRYQRTHLEDMMNIFLKIMGSTISFGVGESIEAAFLNLRRAKASGRGKIVESGVG